MVIDTGDQIIHFKKRKLHFPLHLQNVYLLPRVCCAVIDTLRSSLALRKTISCSLNLLAEDQFWQKFKNLLPLVFWFHDNTQSQTNHLMKQLWKDVSSFQYFCCHAVNVISVSKLSPTSLTAHLYLLITSPCMDHKYKTDCANWREKTGQFPIYVTHLLHNLRNVSLIQFCSVVWAKTHLSGFIQPYSLYKTSTLFQCTPLHQGRDQELSAAWTFK